MKMGVEKIPAYRLYRTEYENRMLEDIEKQKAELKEEIACCPGVRAAYANRVEKFMIENGIWHLCQLDYRWREAYRKTLENGIRPKTGQMYMKAFDMLKVSSISKTGVKSILSVYRDKLLYLPYDENPDVRGMFFRITEKDFAVWDFGAEAPELMKRQVFQILRHILKEDISRETRLKYLAGLKRFFCFCVEEKIENIELMDLKTEKKFRDNQEGAHAGKSDGIVDLFRKILFLEAKDIHWKAHVWYVERLHLQKERINPSRPIGSFSFLEISNPDSRELMKKYVRYQIGLTDLSIGSLFQEFLYLRRFQEKIPPEVSVRDLTEKQIGYLLGQFEKKEVSEEYFNKLVCVLEQFFRFLATRGEIAQIPFEKDYYLKKTNPRHHDRSVEEKVTIEILGKLRSFPEEIRLMYLHLWAVGLRISEVCALKGDAYCRQGQDVWIQVYQNKMRSYKRVPIPEALYEVMEVYKKRRGICAEGYLFPNSKGGAYSSKVFRDKMIEGCRKCGIQNGEYVFKAHDYRHLAATRFYDKGVSLQGIRDYLGHLHEEMTRQYVDYIPQKLDMANEKFFEEEENSLAWGLMKGDRG